ncbi:hypothetical protein ACFQPF_01550 [Fictibacillus iocasae]|uniref:LysM domain-containing protein n=1 Tax=Fictibacillus iocasae TaxID=2715437 RepID=A0ABW2NM34_9BACL
MKRFVSIIFVVFVFYVIVYDLKVGTLPAAASKHSLTERKQEYALITIKPGETVLSILEKRSNGRKLDVAAVLKQFEQLNPAADPDRILQGKTYKFPLYEKDKQ